MGILVDRTNTSAESNETNNYVSRQITVITGASLEPDLVIITGSPAVTPSTVVPGGAVTLSGWTVKNQGTVASDVFQWLLPIDRCNHNDSGHLPGRQRQHEFGGRGPVCLGRAYPDDTGGNSSGKRRCGDPGGSDQHICGVERDQQLRESANHGDTWRIIEPDLVIITGSPAVTPSTVVPGGAVTLSGWTVKNQGSVESGYFSNGFYLSTDATITTADTYLDGNANTSLAAGAQFAWGGPTLTIPAATAPGNYYVGILVDRTNISAESNETNNYVSRQITVFVLN